MLKGIDISNWQHGLNPSGLLNIDFCIVKATEGTFFIDTCCDGFIQKCIESNILFGFYHFARNDTPELEAQFFYENCKGYINNGIPVLDYEVWGTNDDIQWCERFIKRFQKLSGIWPIIYISASHCHEFTGSWIPEKCGLWVAGYPHDYDNWPKDANCPYSFKPWKFAAIWQFTSGLTIAPGFTLDGDIAYMTRNAWNLYAGVKQSQETGKVIPEKGKTCEELASEVLADKWGTGEKRKQSLDSAYGNGTYEHVQTIVNEKLGE